MEPDQLLVLVRSRDPEDWPRAVSMIEAVTRADQLPQFTNALFYSTHPSRHAIFQALLALDNPKPHHELILLGAVRNLDVPLAQSAVDHIDRIEDQSFFSDCIKFLDNQKNVTQELEQEMSRKQCDILSMMLPKMDCSDLERLQLIHRAYWDRRQDLFNLLYPYVKDALDRHPQSFETPAGEMVFRKMEAAAQTIATHNALTEAVDGEFASKPTAPTKKM